MMTTTGDPLRTYGYTIREMIENCAFANCNHRANIEWTNGGICIPVCWHHYKESLIKVLGIGRETAVGVGDG